MHCPDCGMGYDPEYPRNQRQHQTYHDEIMHGTPIRPFKSETVCWRQGGERIVVVTAYSPQIERVHARKVGRVANQEMGYDGGMYDENEDPDERDIHLFLFCTALRGIGLAIFERRTYVCPFTWLELDRGSWSGQKIYEEHTPLWTLGVLWIHKTARRSGRGHRLFQEAIKYLGVPPEEVGLHLPFSLEGEAFARAVFPTGFLAAS